MRSVSDPMDKCEIVCELLPDFISHRLSGQEKLLVFRHISECGKCRSELVFAAAVKQDFDMLCELDEEQSGEMLAQIKGQIGLESSENGSVLKPVNNAFNNAASIVKDNYQNTVRPALSFVRKVLESAELAVLKPLAALASSDMAS